MNCVQKSIQVTLIVSVKLIWTVFTSFLVWITIIKNVSTSGLDNYAVLLPVLAYSYNYIFFPFFFPSPLLSETYPVNFHFYFTDTFSNRFHMLRSVRFSAYKYTPNIFVKCYSTDNMDRSNGGTPNPHRKSCKDVH